MYNNSRPANVDAPKEKLDKKSEESKEQDSVTWAPLVQIISVAATKSDTNEMAMTIFAQRDWDTDK
ncbi:GH10467 [Drosophila grimshawi]|nr:GH10467 [Drosophila grimshawi]